MLVATAALVAASFFPRPQIFTVQGNALPMRLQAAADDDRLRLISTLKKTCDRDEVGRIASELEPRDVYEHTMVIGAFTRSGDGLGALEEFDTMRQQHGIQPTLVSFNAALSACAKLGDWQRAQSLLDEIRSRQMSPDTVSFNAAISACARAGRPRQALKLLTTMRRVGCAPNLITFNGALVAARAVGQSEIALQLLTQMRDREIAPNVASYGAAVSACRRSGDGESAASLVDAMVAEEMVPSESLLTDALGACAKSGAHVAAEQLWARLRESEAGPSARAFSARIHERGTAGDWQSAVSLLDEMLVAGVAPDASCCNQAARACGRSGAWEAAIDLVRCSLESYGVEPTDRMWCSAIHACDRAGNVATAMQLLEEAERASALSTSVCGAAMHALAYKTQDKEEACLEVGAAQSHLNTAYALPCRVATMITIPADRFPLSNRAWPCCNAWVRVASRKMLGYTTVCSMPAKEQASGSKCMTCSSRCVERG